MQTIAETCVRIAFIHQLGFGDRCTHVSYLKVFILQVIKNIKNVAGCRDTRTAKSKETRGMIEHNSEVYNHPYRDLLPYIHVQ